MTTDIDLVLEHTEKPRAGHTTTHAKNNYCYCDVLELMALARQDEARKIFAAIWALEYDGLDDTPCNPRCESRTNSFWKAMKELKKKFVKEGVKTMKALGKKPSSFGGYQYSEENAMHYRQALIEAADELDHDCLDECGCFYKKLANKMRISAGVE